MTCEALRALQLRPEKPHQERTGNEERGYTDHQKAPEDACRTALIDHVAKEYGEDRVEESCRTQLIHMVILVGGARWRQSLAPAVGFEPTTWRLTAARSTTELRRIDRGRGRERNTSREPLPYRPAPDPYSR